MKQIDKAASHQLLYENSISYIRSFSNTIIYGGNKDPYIYSISVHLSKTYSLKTCSLFRSDLQKQKNAFLVHIDYALYFYFSGLSLRKAADDDRLVACFIKRNHVSIWNWWIQKYRPTEKLLLSSTKKRRRIKEFIVLMWRAD